MLKRNVRVLITLAFLLTLTVVMLPFVLTDAQASAAEHVYFGYVPPSTDVFNPNAETEAPAPEMA